MSTFAEPKGAHPRLILFGGPTVQAREGRIALSPTQDLLMVLLWGHEAAGLPRRLAIGLLWEEDDVPRTRQRLRQLLHEIRGRLGLDPFDTTDEDLLRPHGQTLSSDLQDFRVALSTGNLSRALALQPKPFASRLRRSPGEEYDDWLNGKRVALTRELRNAAASQWDRCHRAGDWTGARVAGEVLHSMDPTSEVALRRLIEARGMTGSLQESETAFASFVDALPRDREPQSDTLHLMERIRRLHGGAGRTLTRTVEKPPPLVGRHYALDAARSMLDRVMDGRFEFLLLKGEAGVGKTRLIDEIRREAILKGMRCLEARPVALEQRIPLNPLIDALVEPDVARHVRALHEPWRSVIASLLPRLPEGMDPPVVPPIAETSLSRRLYDAFSILFSRIAAEEPTVFLIDDLQWADATTLAVLQFVQRRWESGSLGVVASLRPVRGSPNPGVARYEEGNRDLPVTSVELKDLAEDEALSLIDAVADGSLDAETRRRLCDLGGRNPFYLIELTKDYVAGRLRLPDLPRDAIAIPISLRQLVDPRLDGLTAGAADAAAAMAVWGRWMKLDDLAAVTQAGLTDTADRVEELERSRLVVVRGTGVRISHELFRGAVYHRIGQARRALLHRLVAVQLEATEPLPHGELALHFDRAGDAAAATMHGQRAADAALESGAMAEAAYFFQVVTQNAEDDVQKAEATADLARVLHMNREIGRAVPLLELAATRLRGVDNHDRALRMDIRRVEGLAEVGSTPMPDLLDRLARIKASARDARDWEALALALDSELHLLHRSGRVGEIRSLFHEIRECSSAPDPAAACVANASLALNVLFGDGREALERARAAVRLAEEKGLRTHVFRAQSRLILVLIYKGMLALPEGQALLAAAAEVAETSGDRTLRFYLEANRGVFAMDTGDLDAAEAAFDRAAPLLVKSDPGIPDLNLLYNRGELSLRCRRYPEARDLFLRAEAHASRSSPTYLVELVTAGLGLAYLELGMLSEAREQHDQLSEHPEWWYFDPSLILEFRCRVLQQHGSTGTAIELLQGTRVGLDGRLTTAWIKLHLLEARLRKRGGQDVVDGLREALCTATELGLERRVLQIQSLLRR